MINEYSNSNDIKAGYLVVKTFQKMYHDYVIRYNLTRDCYAIPRIDKNPEQYIIQYRGLDRDALDGSVYSDILAEVRLTELFDSGRSVDGFLSNYDDALDVYSYLENKEDYEIIWTRINQSLSVLPKHFIAAGFEPTYFGADHFAPQCDCMLFPRWHGTDEEGLLFQEYFRKLNRYGLFESVKDVEYFLKYYLSFDWTEHDEYKIVEVFIRY